MSAGPLEVLREGAVIAAAREALTATHNGAVIVVSDAPQPWASCSRAVGAVFVGAAPLRVAVDAARTRSTRAAEHLEAPPRLDGVRVLYVDAAGLTVASLPSRMVRVEVPETTAPGGRA